MIVPNPDDLPPITQAEALRIMQRSDQARHGLAGQGRARPGKAGQGRARQGRRVNRRPLGG